MYAHVAGETLADALIEVTDKTVVARVSRRLGLTNIYMPRYYLLVPLPYGGNTVYPNRESYIKYS